MELKHDGYRLIVQRDGKRVRLFTRNGHDWSARYPRIVEAALRNRNHVLRDLRRGGVVGTGSLISTGCTHADGSVLVRFRV